MTAARIKQLVAEHFGEFLPELACAEDLDPSMHFERDLGGDSLDKAELVMHTEEAFDIRIPDERLAQIQTVQHLIDAANEQLGITKCACRITDLDGLCVECGTEAV